MVKFLCDAFSPEEANIIVFGVPLGKKSLKNLREVSRLIEPFDLIKERNVLENVKVADIGNIQIKDPDNIFRKTKEIIAKSKVPLILGGNHLLTLYAVGGLAENTKIIIFDAHCDLKDAYLGTKHNFATWLRRLCDSIGTNNIVLLGVRSGEEEELEFMKKNNLLYFTSKQIKEKPEEVKENLRKFLGNSPMYISVDMDVFDPSIAPAVANVEHDGILHSDFVRLIDEICKNKLIGLDIVEIEPLPENRITEFLAIKIIFEILGRLKP